MKVRLKAVLVQARALSSDKNVDARTEALKQAEQILFEFADYLIQYTFDSRVKIQLENPKNMSPEKKETFKKQVVSEKLADFTKILNDTLNT